jgi:hypothetical protein
MTEQTVDIKLKINFPVIFITVVILHLLVMLSKGMPAFTLAHFLPQKDQPTTLKIRRVKTAKVEHSLVRPMNSVLDASAPKPKGPVSLRDLSIGGGRPEELRPTATPSRPGTRPEVVAKSTKAMNTISLKSKEFKDYSKSFPSGGLAISDMITNTQKISDAVVSIEVPEGINPNELNEYELMFYGFQRRTAINYVNSILKNLEKFQKKYPNYRLANSGRITMTARITYDTEGNVQQIKMIRWTHLNEIQNLFEDIVKNIDQLHNPPKALWEKNGEFSMFYTLEIVNG